MRREYFELLHGLVRRPPAGQGRHFWIYGVPEFPADSLPRARELFQRAEAAVQDEAVRERVRKARLPDGEWRIVDGRSGTALAVRFRTEQVARANLSWTAKPQKRVTMDVWSKPQVLAPGERLELEADYGIR